MSFINISEILHDLHIKPSMTAAEFGSGAASFALALAKKLHKGRMYALDIQQEKLSALKSKISLDKLNNVMTIHCDLEAENGSTLKNNSCNIVVIPNLLFQSENKHAILKEAYRILKRTGQCLVLDWLKESPIGPRSHAIASPKEIKKISEDLGFSLKKEFAAGDYHYGLLFAK